MRYIIFKCSFTVNLISNQRLRRWSRCIARQQHARARTYTHRHRDGQAGDVRLMSGRDHARCYRCYLVVGSAICFGALEKKRNEQKTRKSQWVQLANAFFVVVHNIVVRIQPFLTVCRVFFLVPPFFFFFSHFRLIHLWVVSTLPSPFFSFISFFIHAIVPIDKQNDENRTHTIACMTCFSLLDLTIPNSAWRSIPIVFIQNIHFLRRKSIHHNDNWSSIQRRWIHTYPHKLEAFIRVLLL